MNCFEEIRCLQKLNNIIRLFVSLRVFLVRGIAETIVSRAYDKKQFFMTSLSRVAETLSLSDNTIVFSLQIKSMIGHAIDGTLTDRLDRLASGMPCVQLLVCRLSPIVSDMQRRVREDVTRPRRRDDSDAEAPWWNVSDWRRVGETARLCAAKHRDCTAKTAVIRPAVVRD